MIEPRRKKGHPSQFENLCLQHLNHSVKSLFKWLVSKNTPNLSPLLRGYHRPRMTTCPRIVGHLPNPRAFHPKRSYHRKTKRKDGRPFGFWDGCVVCWSFRRIVLSWMSKGGNLSHDNLRPRPTQRLQHFW